MKKGERLMNRILPRAIGLIPAFGLALLLPTSSFATTRVGAPSSCTGSGNFSVAISYDQSTQKPRVDNASNSTCVEGGNTVSMSATLPALGWSWSVSFPSQSAGGSVFTNSCTFGSSANTTCTVVSGPGSGDYNYSITMTDPNGGTHVLDPKVIIKGIGRPTPRKHTKQANPPSAAAPPPQQ